MEKEGCIEELELEGDISGFVPSLILGTNGIPLINEGVPNDGECYEALSGEGPKMIIA